MTAKTAHFLTREEILGADDRTTETVDVPEWGGVVTVRSLTGTQRGQYEASGTSMTFDGSGKPTITPRNPELLRARIVSMSLVDAEGKQLFTEADLLALGGKNAEVLSRIGDVALRLAGLTKRDLEVLEKGLKADQNGSSGSD
jgi:hypothetical protein